MTPDMWKGLVVIVIAYVALMAVCMSASRRLRNRVFNNLDYAAENGYFEPGEYCHGMSAGELAYDLTCFSPDFEDARAVDLEPHAAAWKAKRKL